ncbi:zinc ribbon domain-containing protein [Haladaptatus sp. DJG-WS-42]|uniref:zinc ribbon domain-containing protein n=1 Tax=Haladaptatus sp. DJG-WS-42 TaxID=3120516 RepID=UPI0030CF1A75
MLAFIIFGWSTRFKEYGATYPAACPHCSNDNYFHLLKSRRWFKLYFIPLIPLSRAAYDLVCPTCNASIRLDSRAEATQAKHLNTATTAYHNEELDVEDYSREMKAFETDVFENPNGQSKDYSENYQGASGPPMFRYLMALMFVIALGSASIGVYQLEPFAIVPALFMLPYLAIRYRDPDSTTIPLASYVSR